MQDPTITRRKVLRGIGASATLFGGATADAVAATDHGQFENNQKSDGKAIESALLTIAEYMTLYNDNTLAIDVEQAKKDDIAESTITTGQDFEKLHNATIESINEDEFLEESATNPDLQQKFEPYFMLVAAGNAKRIVPATTEEGSALNPRDSRHSTEAVVEHERTRTPVRHTTGRRTGRGIRKAMSKTTSRTTVSTKLQATRAATVETAKTTRRW